ncbi:hypothetical protein A0H81_05113 [Grifola frondosa]|uniref:Uncharacterized protein n=1 Tax=Grifola frondosa TaxID=5627 RepID=A0A1C7MCC8_GRIFR|nr:hypothetical protein A0H81_05113 [Grifola frondosa]
MHRLISRHVCGVFRVDTAAGFLNRIGYPDDSFTSRALHRASIRLGLSKKTPPALMPVVSYLCKELHTWILALPLHTPRNTFGHHRPAGPPHNHSGKKKAKHTMIDTDADTTDLVSQFSALRVGPAVHLASHPASASGVQSGVSFPYSREQATRNILTLCMLTALLNHHDSSESHTSRADTHGIHRIVVHRFNCRTASILRKVTAGYPRKNVRLRRRHSSIFLEILAKV